MRKKSLNVNINLILCIKHLLNKIKITCYYLNSNIYIFINTDKLLELNIQN
jgi:hypothetical protein